MTIIRHASFKKELDVTQPKHTKTSMNMYSYQILNIQTYQIIGIAKAVPKCTF